MIVSLLGACAACGLCGFLLRFRFTEVFGCCTFAYPITWIITGVCSYSLLYSCQKKAITDDKRIGKNFKNDVVYEKKISTHKKLKINYVQK